VLLLAFDIYSGNIFSDVKVYDSLKRNAPCNDKTAKLNKNTLVADYICTFKQFLIEFVFHEDIKATSL
jgi:hypothetical protein